MNKKYVIKCDRGWLVILYLEFRLFFLCHWTRHIINLVDSWLYFFLKKYNSAVGLKSTPLGTHSSESLLDSLELFESEVIEYFLELKNRSGKGPMGGIDSDLVCELLLLCRFVLSISEYRSRESLREYFGILRMLDTLSFTWGDRCWGINFLCILIFEGGV